MATMRRDPLEVCQATLASMAAKAGPGLRFNEHLQGDGQAVWTLVPNWPTHLLYDPTRLDLLFKSIAQSIKFIGRFGDKQWRLRQKRQLVFSTHLTHSSELTRGPGQWLARRTRWSARSANHSPSLH
jgi:hypothetical protein